MESLMKTKLRLITYFNLFKLIEVFSMWLFKKGK